MRTLPRTRFGRLLIGCALLAGGCKGGDADILARVGRKVVLQVEGATANSKLASGWQAIRGTVDDVAVDARVAARLSWDKALTGIPFQVQASDGRVELRGTVPGQPQRSRAVELAESTAGVTEVIDALQVLAQGP